MKGLKNFLSIVLLCAMILPMGISSFAAWHVDEAITDNWTPMAAKYSKGTWRIIAPKAENYVIRTKYFDFSKDENDGVKITTPTYEEFAGTYGVSAITSKATTPLDGLSVVIQPDEFDSMVDTMDKGNSLNILWTEEKIEGIAGFNEATKLYDSGLFSAVSVYSDGLRDLIPVVDGATPRTPSYMVSNQANGKALMIRICCDRADDNYAPTATSVSIVYYDGYYINDDGHTGYQWKFTAINHEDTQISNSTGTSRGYENIDLSNGLAVNVRADDTLGFIVNINGYDYYKGEEVAFFPDCDTDWVGYKTSDLTDDKIHNMDSVWTSSMTYARADIDLTGLRDAGNGYVTVGATSNNDQKLTDHRCNYTVKSINGVAVADWAGETTPEHDCDFAFGSAIDPTCTRDGYDYYRCKVCGAADNRNIVPAIGHTPKEDITVIENPTCSTYGISSRNCFICKARVESYFDEPTEHLFEVEIITLPSCGVTGYGIEICSVCGAQGEEIEFAGTHIYKEDFLLDPTCTEEGIALMMCTCGDYYITDIPAIPHLFENYTYNNDATCTEDGTKTAYCEYGCGVSDTITANGTASHSYVEEIIRFATCTKTGIMMMICDCGDYYTEDIPRVSHSYTNYEYNDDATCTKDGTKTAYCDYGCGASDTVTAKGTVTDHDYTGVVTKEATCTATGIMTYTCRFCSDSYTEIIPKAWHSFVPDFIKEPTCTSTGIILYMCECRAYYTETAPKAEHSFGGWSVTVAPTDTSKGEESRSCSVCGTVETRETNELPTPELTINNYTITITNAEYIKDARYVLGAYTTTAEIRNAPGNVALDNKVIKNNTVEGSFVYDLPDGGVYSIWVRMTDGRNYILPVDMTKFTPKVTTYGVKITVDGLYDTKDFFIAKGQFNSYNEIKNNGYIVRVTASKIAGKHSYTYTVSEPGMHTVLVRYNDGTEHIFHEDLTVDEPVFTTNGLQVTVSNIPDVKVIRTAYGEYTTPGDTKRAEGARNFSNKSVIKDAEEYLLQYREEGIVTIVVEYNNGYVKVFHYDVQKKTPYIEKHGNKITIDNLDGLNVIRYAEGEYFTSKEIKAAKGSVVIKPNELSDGIFTVNLDAGTYSFCVQYNDESYYYYHCTVTDLEAVGSEILTRGKMASVLAEREAVDLTPYMEYESVFSDLTKDHEHYAACMWAYDSGYLAGMSDTIISPDSMLTREQVARLLYNWAVRLGLSDLDKLGDLSMYSDTVSPWAKTEVSWAVGNGIMTGLSDTYFGFLRTAIVSDAYCVYNIK